MKRMLPRANLMAIQEKRRKVEKSAMTMLFWGDARDQTMQFSTAPLRRYEGNRTTSTIWGINFIQKRHVMRGPWVILQRF